jgi:uncharacterized protein YjiS (DUF1127 family)
MTMIHETQIAAGHAGTFLSRIAEVVRSFAALIQARREFKHLNALDDYMLRDIGLSRDDLIVAGSAPLTEDPMIALIRASRSR